MEIAVLVCGLLFGTTLLCLAKVMALLFKAESSQKGNRQFKQWATSLLLSATLFIIFFFMAEVAVIHFIFHP